MDDNFPNRNVIAARNYPIVRDYDIHAKKQSQNRSQIFAKT